MFQGVAGFFLSAIETKVIFSLIKCYSFVCVFTDIFRMLCKNGTFFMHAFLSFIAHGGKMNISIQSDFEIDLAQCHC